MFSVGPPPATVTGQSETAVLETSYRSAMISPIAVGIAILFAPTAVDAQSIAPNVLPFPTGPFPIGRVTYHWIDSSRPEFLDIAAPRRRELLVDVWYPARSALREHAGAYLPELTRLQTILTDSVLQREFAPAYSAMVAGQLSTHAKEGAPAKCPSSGCPLLIFSHGGGVDRSFYCSQYEDFASHGYIVAAIAHTYDTHLVVFPDGRVVGAAPTFRDTLSLDSSLPVWRRELARELRSQTHLRRVIEVEARDILFVIDELDRYAGDARLRAPFLHQVDFQRVGALGHSAGGEAAARACQLEPRIGACLNQDGVMQNLPFARDSTGRKMNQPFMYIGRRFSPLPLSDAQLAAMQLTRAEADSLFRAIANGQQSLLSDMPGGAYRITLKFPGIGHMSFSDEPLDFVLVFGSERRDFQSDETIELRIIGLIDATECALAEKLLDLAA